MQGWWNPIEALHAAAVTIAQACRCSEDQQTARGRMPTPMEYRLASQDFDRFLAEVAEQTNLGSRHQAYTTTQAVFQCFRRRLDTRDAIAFAQILPAMLRALFVQDWDPDEPTEQSWDRLVMTAEVKRLRVNHNFSPDSAISDVARVLRKYLDPKVLDSILSRLPEPARAFWMDGAVIEPPATMTVC